ncbi:sensor histidine kinase [Martelella endophytica]|uniref:sensor histidine kinase n=1 Tax=Martelella endophytica TaxID=1486262 RepID=UPI00130DED4E|nr:HAMP domain-containing sensor histidine kinase [Martelella endophytica]
MTEAGRFRQALATIDRNAPALGIFLMLTSAGFVYLGRDLIFLLWALAALALHAIALIMIRRARREGGDAERLAQWNARVIGAHWIAGGAWALLAFIDCGACSGTALPFFKGAMVIIALAMMALSAAALPRSAWHVFMPAVAAFGVVAWQSRSTFDIGLAAALAVVMVFIAFFNSHIDESDKALGASESEKDALNARLSDSLRQAEAAAETAEQASKAKSAFLAAMSHDLRTPLNAIIGFSEIMQNEMMGPIGHPYYREYAGDIHRSGRHLLDMIDGVLDLSRLEAGGYRLTEQPVFLSDIIDASMAIAGSEASRRGIAIRTEAEARLSPLMADSRALKQILVNLLSNAVKFSPDGSEIIVSAGFTETGGQYLAVRDHGAGMDAQALAEATNAFARGANADNVEGFGLGLSIVSGLADAHQATLDLQSAPGDGTLAAVLFPAARVVSLPAAAVVEATSGTQLPLSPAASLPFAIDSIEVEATTRTGRDRLAAALKRRARRVANDDTRQAAPDAEHMLEEQLEAEIIDALDAARTSADAA